MLKTPVHSYPHQLQLVNADVAEEAQDLDQITAADKNKANFKIAKI